MSCISEKIANEDDDLESIIYIDQLLEKEKYSRLKLIDNIEIKAGKIISVIALILTLEVALVTNIKTFESPLVIVLYIIHIVLLSLSAIYAIKGYRIKSYFDLYGGKRILSRYLNNSLKSKRDILLQNISNSDNTSSRLMIIRQNKQKDVRLSLYLLLIGELPTVILLLLLLLS